MERINGNSNGSTAFVKGWSWGDIKLSSECLDFEAGSQQWFTVPYSVVGNVLLPSQNEIALEFNNDDEE